MPDDITLRSPTADELIAFFRPLADAFGEAFPDVEIEYERELVEFDRSIGAFDGETRVGTASAHTFRLTVPGGEVGASGITSVGVRPDHRRQGILRRLMDWLIEDALAHAEPVAVLTASEAAIYHRFGFGQASTATSFSFASSRAMFRDPIAPDDRVRIRMVDSAEATRAFAQIYDQIRGEIPGALSRSEPRWRLLHVGDAEWMRRGQGIKYLALLEVDGQPRGYAIYRINSAWDPTGPNSTMTILEVLGADAGAEQTLWQWLFSIDLVGTFAGRRGPNPHPLQHWLLEPRRTGLTVSDNLWLRILDLPTTLAARTYSGEGRVVLDVADAMIDSNAGRWELAVDGGRATVTRSTAEPHLSLDIATLAAAYLGAFRFGDLAVAGRVRAVQPGALGTADMLFTPSRAPWCATPF